MAWALRSFEMVICKVIGCDEQVRRGWPADTEGMCLKCWEEYTALKDMRRAKEDRDALQDD